MPEEHADFPGLGNRIVMRGEKTDGRFAVVEHTLAPRALGSPVHTHTNEDEYSFVTGGRLGVMIGDEVREAGPGEFVEKPRGIRHAFWNAADEETRLVELISPAGFEQYFVDLAPILNAAGPPDAEALGEVWQRYALSMEPESVPDLIERFGLAPPPG
jgi:quercetin dioxygenase-like cupin family protein